MASRTPSSDSFPDLLAGGLDPRVLIEAFESLNLSFWVQAAAGGPPGYISRALQQLTGFGPDAPELRPLRWLNAVPAEDRERVRKALGDQLADAEPATLECRLLTLSGELRWVQARYRTFCASQGQQLQIGLLSDITAERAAEAETRAQAQRRQFVLDHLGEGVAVVDQSGRFLSLNAAGARLLGLEAADAAPDCWEEAFGAHLNSGDESQPAEDSPIRRALMGEAVSNSEICLRGPKGQDAYLLVTATPMRDERGKVTGAVSVFRDISALHLAEEQLRQTSDRLRYVFERLNQGFLTLNKDWCITFFNRAAWEIFGRLSPSELMRHKLWALFPDAAQPERLFFTEFQRAIREGVNLSFREYLPSLDRWFEVNAYPFQSELDVFLQDITAARRHEQLLQFEKELLSMVTRTDLSLGQLLDRALASLSDVFPARDFALLRLRRLDDHLALITAPELAPELVHRWELAMLQAPEAWADWFSERTCWLWQPGLAHGPLDTELAQDTGRAARLLPVRFSQGQLIGVLGIFYHGEAWKDPAHEVPFFERAALLLGHLAEAWLAEWQLRLSNERFDLASRATNDAIWDWNLQSHTLGWNQAVESIFGYAPEQLASRSHGWYLNLHPQDRDRVVQGLDDHLARGDSRWQDEYRFRHRDGSYRYVLDRGYLLCNAQGEPVRMIGAMQDITRLKLNERHILAQNQGLLEIAWKQSHEVRRPLANILGLIHLLELEPGLRDQLAPLQREASALDTIIQEIVAMSERVLKSVTDDVPDQVPDHVPEYVSDIVSDSGGDPVTGPLPTGTTQEAQSKDPAER